VSLYVVKRTIGAGDVVIPCFHPSLSFERAVVSFDYCVT